MGRIRFSKYDVYEFIYNGVLFEIEHRYNIYYSYIYDNRKRIWLENKDTVLKDAINTCLCYIGISKKERLKIKIEL